MAKKKPRGLDAVDASSPSPPDRASRRGSSGPSNDGTLRRILGRYRGLVVAAVAVAGVGMVGLFVLQAGTASSYSCASLLTPPPASAPSPRPFDDGTPRLGFTVDDGGKDHASAATSVRYATCPPTSGTHSSAGPLERQFYGPGAVQLPGRWVHNLEHGYAVIAYAGDPGAAVLDQIRNVMDRAAPTDVADSCGLPNKVIALRFDDMSEPFALLAWDKALLMPTFDVELASRAADQFQDQAQAPERAC